MVDTNDDVVHDNATPRHSTRDARRPRRSSTRSLRAHTIQRDADDVTPPRVPRARYAPTGARRPAQAAKQPDAAAAHNQRFHTLYKADAETDAAQQATSAANSATPAPSQFNTWQRRPFQFGQLRDGAAPAGKARASNARDGGGSSGIADEAATSLHALLAARTAAVMSREQADVTPRSLTSIVWAMGKLRLFDTRLRDEMASHAASQLTRGLLDPFGIANVAWASRPFTSTRRPRRARR